MSRAGRRFVAVIGLALVAVVALAAANRRALRVRWSEHVLETSQDAGVRRQAVQRIFEDGDDAAIERVGRRLADPQDRSIPYQVAEVLGYAPRGFAAVARAIGASESNERRGELLKIIRVRALRTFKNERLLVHHRGDVFFWSDPDGERWQLRSRARVEGLAWAEWLVQKGLAPAALVEDLRPHARLDNPVPGVGARFRVEHVVAEATTGGAAAAAGLEPGDRLDLVGLPKPSELEDPTSAEEIERERTAARDQGSSTVSLAIQRAGTFRTLELPAKGELGLRLRPRLVVRQVFPDLPGARAGLRVRDAILSADGVAITSQLELEQVAAVPGKQRVVLQVLRAGKPLEVVVPLEPE